MGKRHSVVEKDWVVADVISQFFSQFGIENDVGGLNIAWKKDFYAVGNIERELAGIGFFAEADVSTASGIKFNITVFKDKNEKLKNPWYANAEMTVIFPDKEKIPRGFTRRVVKFYPKLIYPAKEYIFLEEKEFDYGYCVKCSCKCQCAKCRQARFQNW